MAMTPAAIAPLYHQRDFWKSLVLVKPVASMLYHMFQFREAESSIVNMVKYCEATCWSTSASGPNRPSPKAPVWGMERALYDKMRLAPVSEAAVFQPKTAPWSWATRWNLSTPTASATANTSLSMWL